MTDEIESGRSVTEEEREDPTHASGTDMAEDDRSSEPAPRPSDQGRGEPDEDRAHRIGIADSGQTGD